MPFGGGLLCMAARLSIILGGVTETTFMVSAFAFSAAISFLVPYFLRIYAELDAVGNIMICLGFATGPAAGSLLIVNNQYDRIIWTGVAALAISLVLVMPACIRSPRGELQADASV